MSPEDEWRVQHMIDACKQAIEFATGRSRSDLDTNNCKALTEFTCNRGIAKLPWARPQ